MEIWEPKPPGTLWATPGLLRDSFTFTFFFVGDHRVVQYPPVVEMERLSITRCIISLGIF